MKSGAPGPSRSEWLLPPAHTRVWLLPGCWVGLEERNFLLEGRRAPAQSLPPPPPPERPRPPASLLGAPAPDSSSVHSPWTTASAPPMCTTSRCSLPAPHHLCSVTFPVSSESSPTKVISRERRLPPFPSPTASLPGVSHAPGSRITSLLRISRVD